MIPLSLSAQHDSTFKTTVKLADLQNTLQPIRIIESPGTYAEDGSMLTAPHRVYKHNGTEVSDPRRTLTPIVRAINDPDANRELREIEVVQNHRQTNLGIGLTLSIGGFVMVCAGAMQAAAYNKTLNAQRDSYYAVPAYSTVTTTKPVYVECSIWTGLTDPKTGVTLYTCATNRLIQSTNPGVGPYPIPGSAVTTTSTVYTPRDNPPTTVNLPNGKGLLTGGVVSLSVGLLVACLGTESIDHFYEAVRHYNRALSRKISWRLEPYSTYGHPGLTLRGRF